MQEAYICFSEYWELLKKFVIDSSKYDGVVCPLRGGAYIADPISRRFNLPIHYLHLKSYKDKEQSQIELVMGKELPAGNYLICDDIYDTGQTVHYIKKSYPHCTFDIYCLVSKQDKYDVMYSKLVPIDCWVNFYWETFKEM